MSPASGTGTGTATARIPRPGPTRIVGLDLARFLALAGMMATHVWLYADLPASATNGGSALFEGRASALFAVLAGAGAVLATRAPLRRGRRASARWTLVGRGVALVALGLTVTLLPNPILVILAYYGVMFWLLALVLTWPTWALVLTGSVVAVVTPVLAYLLGLVADIPGAEGGNLSWLSFGEPLVVLRSLLLTGSYPALIWLAYGIAGMLVGRALVAARDAGALQAVGIRIGAIGAAVWLGGVALAGLAQNVFGGVHALALDLGVDDAMAQAVLDHSGAGRPLPGSSYSLLAAGPHHGTSLDLLVTIGFAVTAIGVLVYVGTLLPPLARRILTPVTAAGAAPLTVYTAHVLVVGTVTLLMLGKPFSELTYREYVAIDDPWFLSSAGFLIANIVVALLIGTLLATLGRRGPLETFVTATGRRFGRLGGPNPDAGPSRNTAAPSVVG